MELEQKIGSADIPLARLVEAALVLHGAGHLAVAQSAAQVQSAAPQAARLNAHLAELAQGSGDITFLASPVTGGGMHVNRFQQMFLHARAQGHAQPAQWAQRAWATLKAQGQRLLKDGQAIASEEDNLAELTRQAQEFADRQLPVLRALGVA